MGGPRPRGAAGVVFRKEMRETFRDWRTVFTVVISPLLLTPLLLALVGDVIQREGRKERTEVLRIALVRAPETTATAAFLKRLPNLAIEETPRAEAEEGIRKRRFRTAVVLPAGADRQLDRGSQINVQLLVDPGNEGSQRAASRLTEFFEEQGSRIAAGRVREAGLPADVLKPFRVKNEPVPGSGSVTTLLLATFLPHHGHRRHSGECVLGERHGGRGEGARDAGGAAGLAGDPPRPGAG